MSDKAHGYFRMTIAEMRSELIQVIKKNNCRSLGYMKYIKKCELHLTVNCTNCKELNCTNPTASLNRLCRMRSNSCPRVQRKQIFLRAFKYRIFCSLCLLVTVRQSIHLQILFIIQFLPAQTRSLCFTPTTAPYIPSLSHSPFPTIPSTALRSEYRLKVWNF